MTMQIFSPGITSSVPLVKRVAIVSSHFPPSNLAGVHRARLWARHLAEFGWQPVIVTVDERDYLEPNEPDLARLVAPDVEVIRVRAWRTTLGGLVNDVGIRGFYPVYRALDALVRDDRIDFILVTIPGHYLAPVARLVAQRNALPFGLDFQDPWVHEPPEPLPLVSKARLSHWLADRLEPWSVRGASLLTAINPGYLEGVLARNPEVAAHAQIAYAPIGAAMEDHTYLLEHPRDAYLFGGAHTDSINLVYAGVLPAHMIPPLRAILQATARLCEQDPELSARLRLYFIGTGRRSNDQPGHVVAPIARALGLMDQVVEVPQRIGYLDVLAHLHAAHGVLMVGSMLAFYSPSKVYSTILSRRPVFAVLRGGGLAVRLLEDCHAGVAVTFEGQQLPDVERLCAHLRDYLSQLDGYAGPELSALEPYTARESARVLSEGLDRSVAR